MNVIDSNSQILNTFENEIIKIEGNIFQYEDKGNYYLVVAEYETELINEKIILYTQAFKVYKSNKTTKNIIIIISSLFLLICGISFLFIKKNNFNKK